ncbi:TPA: 4Fe-4S binding protein [Yersinia enterocolitica]|nr:4Fe-4S binding protein [Yersinia enterocolitica]
MAFDNDPTLVDKLCDGCGECAVICPAMALEMTLSNRNVRG